MIKRVFFDMDETLLWTEEFDYNKEFDPADGFDFHTKWDFPQQKFQTSLRPSAKRTIDYAKEVVGEENVFVLTRSSNDLAAGTMFHSKLGIPYERVFGYEDHAHWKEFHAKQTPFKFAEAANVLIDNEEHFHRYSVTKRLFLGINSPELVNRYLKVDPYQGNPCDQAGSEKFFNDVKNFLDGFKVVR